MLERNKIPFPLRKTATLLVARFARQLNGLGKIHSHFLRRVGVGAERDGHACLKRELEDFAARIDFLAILPQAGGVEFNGATVLFRGVQKLLVKRRAVRRRWVPEFFRQIGMADDFEETGFGGLGQPLKINRPDFAGVAVFPLGQFLRDHQWPTNRRRNAPSR